MSWPPNEVRLVFRSVEEKEAWVNQLIRAWAEGAIEMPPIAPNPPGTGPCATCRDPADCLLTGGYCEDGRPGARLRLIQPTES